MIAFSPARAPLARTRRMRATTGAALALALGAALGCPAPAMADVKAGVDAWARGDFATAIHEWEGPAAHGDPDAEFDLGQAYKLGRGVTQDLARAEALFGQAAAQGHLQAADNYGLLLFQRGDHAKALPFIGGSAERGDPRAQYLLGIALFNGDGIARDWVRAYALESLAQQSGLQPAKIALAQMDKFIPLEQRQQAVKLEADLSQQIEATRDRQSAAVDLGTNLPHATAGPVRAPAFAPPPPLAIAPAPAPAPDASANAAWQAAGSGSVPPAQPEAASAYSPAPAPATPRHSRKPAPLAAAQPEAAPMPAPASNAAPAWQSAYAPPAPPVAAPAPMFAPVPAPAPLSASSEPATPPASAPRLAHQPHAHPAPNTDMAAPTPAPAPRAIGGSWKVQLGAFGVPANAETMWARVKTRPEIAGHPRSLVPTGKVNRLLAGGYSEEGAQTACRKLSASGISCLVTKD